MSDFIKTPENCNPGISVNKWKELINNSAVFNDDDLEYVKRMIEEDVECAEVLIQISASKSALNGLGKEIINEHVSHCITHAVEDNDTEALKEFQTAIEKFL
mgnify:CR=1 FL=1